LDITKIKHENAPVPLPFSSNDRARQSAKSMKSAVVEKKDGRLEVVLSLADL
jgi:hypothetical protein